MKRSAFPSIPLSPVRALLLMAVTLLLTACVTNPVTGEKNLQFYGEDWEREVGAKNYAPMRQAQGGDYVLDESLSAYVDRVGQRVAQHADRDLDYEFEVLNSSIPNAWALPGGKIAINRGLLTALDSEAELAAVLGHEIVHAAAAHGAQQQSKGMLLQGGSLLVGLYGASRAESRAGQQVAMMVPQVGAQLLNQKYSRDAEREADLYGMRYMEAAGYDPIGAVDLQKTFLELSRERRQDWLSGFFASHPPSAERVQLNQETAASLPPGGEIGQAEYQQELAFVERLKPAYDAHDEARKALADGDLRRASELADTAVRRAPSEALFHSLQGDIDATRKNYRSARPHYDRALQLDDSFFYHHLRRGQVRYELGDTRGARADLEASARLLPTAQAALLLGHMARDDGNIRTAAQYYQTAAQAGSKEAQAELGKLQRNNAAAAQPSQSQAARYVQLRLIPDRQGNVYAQLGNPTTSTLANIEVRYRWRTQSGQIQQASKTFTRPLRPGTQANVPLGLRATSAADLRNNIRAEVVGVQVVR